MKNNIFNRNYSIIIIGQFISMLGNSIQRFAFSLYILELTGSAAMFSFIISMAIIPTILLSPFGGAIADRMNKGKIMVVLDFFCCFLLGCFAIFFYGKDHQFLFIAILMIVLSIINSIYEPTVRASIPAVTAKEYLSTANSIVSQISALTNLIGPIAAGFLYGFLGLKAILIINLVSYFISAVMEMFLTIPFKRIEMKQSALITYIKDIKGSIDYLYQQKRFVMYMIFIAAALNLFLTPLYTVGAPYLEKIVFGVSDQLYGISETILGIGMIIGALMSVLINKYIPFEKIHKLFIFIGLLIIGMGLCVTPWILGNHSPHMLSYWLFTLFGFLLMFALANVNIQAITFIQFQVPESIMGKVMALTAAISTVFMPIGQIIFGKLYDILGSILPLIYVIVMTITIGFAKILQLLLQSRHYSKLNEVIE